jgi:hypothetical protein
MGRTFAAQRLSGLHIFPTLLLVEKAPLLRYLYRFIEKEGNTPICYKLLQKYFAQTSCILLSPFLLAALLLYPILAQQRQQAAYAMP